MRSIALAALLAVASATALAQAPAAPAAEQPAMEVVGEAVDIDKMGLDASSPLEVSTPKAFELNAGQYRATEFSMPAVITHPIDGPYFKITETVNPCMACHGDPGKIGKPKVKGVPTVTPASHWTEDAQGKPIIHGRRIQCTICHAPQANVPPLVLPQE